MHLSTEEPAAFWIWNCLEKLAEIFMNTFHGINDAVKSYGEKIVLKTLQLKFSVVC